MRVGNTDVDVCAEDASERDGDGDDGVARVVNE